jgi:hypothetical protein
MRDATLADLGLGDDAATAFLLALHFDTWRLLCERQGMATRDAAALMSRSVIAQASNPMEA